MLKVGITVKIIKVSNTVYNMSDKCRNHCMSWMNVLKREISTKVDVKSRNHCINQQKGSITNNGMSVKRGNDCINYA